MGICLASIELRVLRGTTLNRAPCRAAEARSVRRHRLHVPSLWSAVTGVLLMPRAHSWCQVLTPWHDVKTLKINSTLVFVNERCKQTLMLVLRWPP